MTMTFDEAMKNPKISAIRRKIWASKTDRLILPPVLESGERGLWCKLIANDGVSPQSETDILAMMCDDDLADWEEWQP